MRWTLARARRTAVGAAVAGIGAASCSERLADPLARPHPGGVSATSEGTLRLASLGDIRGLDPAGPLDGVAGEAMELIFAGLVEIDPDGHAVPGLAEAWSVTDDGRTYRFVLRRGVSMHDGAELTADDVVRSVERALDPATPNPNASYFADL